MKKLFLFAAAFMMIFAAQAQLPDNWTGDTDIETFMETATVHSGSYSCGVIVNSGTQANCDFSNDVAIPVSAGDDFKVTFWANTSEFVRITCALDWEGASSLYTNEYVGPATGGWAQFVYEGTVPDGATAVNLRLRFYDVSGFVAPETQFVDDVEFESPIGEPQTVENGGFENWPSMLPEPTNYPTDFAATPVSVNVNLTWTDATGDVLPGAYLIMANTDGNFTTPVDGTYIADDLDLSDGQGAVNVAYGEQTYSFTDLDPMTTYHFVIYPYNNSGTNIDFKNDGTAPTAMAETSNVVVINQQNFDIGWGDWNPVNLLGDQVWDRDNTFGIEGTPCAAMSGYASGDFPNEDWLISPAMNFDEYTNEILTFYTALGYPIADHQLTVKISTDYNGGGDPTTATWENLSATLASGDPFWDWTYSGEIDLSAYNGNVYVAFVYVSDGTDSETWEVDNIKVTGEGQFNPDPEPTNYPTDFAATVNDLSIALTWTDATGETVPTGYLILGSDSDNISLPVDGVEIPDDTDFSDGQGALNIGAGVEAATFSSLMETTTYYFKIFPYTNSGMYIDYKTDGTPPSANATTAESQNILFTDFNQDWGGWTPMSITGDQEWVRTDMYGIEDSPCAKMSGFSGGALDNEDWLISPAIDLSNTINEVLSFYSAMKFDGPPLQVMISNDYDGSGTPSDFTWTDLTDQANWSTGNYEWTLSGDISIADYAGEATYIAFVYTSNTSAASTWEIDNVKVTGETSGIGEIIPESALSVYPNPGNGLMQINTSLQLRNINVFNVTGSLVYTGRIAAGQQQIDLRQLNKGVYMVRFETVEGNYTTRRLIIQ